MSKDKGPADGVTEDSYVVPTMAIREVRDYTSNIVGKIKTLIDAAIVDPQQNKALKDLVHNQIWNDSYMEVVSWAQAQSAGSRSTFPFSYGKMTTEGL